MELFTLNENLNPVINKSDVFLIKEFKALFDPEHCKGVKGDPKGLMKFKALYELTYMYLVYDWKTPYSEYSTKEKEEAAMLDANMEPAWLEDPLFKAAVEKYQSLQDSRILRLLEAAYHAVDELRIYFSGLDMTERDAQGKPIFQTKNVMFELANLGKTVEGLEQLQQLVMKEKEKNNKLRGDSEPGMFD